MDACVHVLFFTLFVYCSICGNADPDCTFGRLGRHLRGNAKAPAFPGKAQKLTAANKVRYSLSYYQQHT